MSAPVSSSQRWTKAKPCPVCAGHPGLPQGRGERCYGFRSADGDYLRCSREERAGGLEQGPDGLYAHRASGSCRCGQVHGAAVAELRERRSAPPKRERTTSTERPRRVAEYLYTDRHGEPRARKVRVEPGRGDRKKDFYWEVPDGRGGWRRAGEGEGNPHLLYGLPAVVEAETVHLCEGEKAADALAARGLVATCSPTTGWEDGYTEELRGKRVVQWVDRDHDGERQARRPWEALRQVATVELVRSRVDDDHADAFDHLTAGFAAEDGEPFAFAGEAGPEEEDPERRMRLELLDRFAEERTRIDSWFAPDGELVEPPPRHYLVEDLIPEKVPALLVARGGTGKGHFELALAVSLATGLPFGRFALERPRGVVVVSREDDREELQRRFVAAVNARFPAGLAATYRERLVRNLRFVDLFGTRGGRLGLDLVHATVETTRRLEDPGLVLLDPLGKMTPLGDGFSLNSQEGAGLVHEWLDVLVQESACAVVAAHHVNKEAAKDGRPTAGAATGSQLLEDLARFVLALTRLEGKDAEAFGLNPDSRFGYVRASLTKSNYAPPLLKPFVFEQVDGGALVPVEAESPKARNAEKALEVLREHGELETDAWAKACEPYMTKNDAKAARGDLERRGLVKHRPAPKEAGRSGAPGRLYFPTGPTPGPAAEDPL